MSEVVSNKKVGIVAGGPLSLLADLTDYQDQIDYWIGCDRGALYLIENDLPVDLAVGDFDSVSQTEFNKIETYAKELNTHPAEKDFTDLELAVNEAKKINVNRLYLFGVTGGRKDHELTAIYMLEKLLNERFEVKLIDQFNQLVAYRPGNYELERSVRYPNISFISLTKQVSGLNLINFYYPLQEATIERGDSLTISNYLVEQKGYFSFDSGILIVIKSGD